MKNLSNLLPFNWQTQVSSQLTSIPHFAVVFGIFTLLSISIIISISIICT